MLSRLLAALLLLPAACAAPPVDVGADATAAPIRFCTCNIQDLRIEQLEGPDTTRARAVAALVQRLRPDVLLVNELETDPDDPERGGRLLAAHLARGDGDRAGIVYEVFAAPVNTGVPSGHDLNRDGTVVADPGTRGYGNDCLGYGAFPGQYGMALLVRRGFTIERADVRTFRTLPWATMPDALLPPGDGARVPADAAWYTPEMLEVLPLSSKSHWDVPVRTPDGIVVHVLASHPTPPVFDGPEDRNGRRNHDEIRFWVDYTGTQEDAAWIVDDAGRVGGLPAGRAFVVMGDLNADETAGGARTGAISALLDRTGRRPAPVGPAEPGERSESTSDFGLRVDYVLPSVNLRIVASAVAGPAGTEHGVPSDHAPVWVDVEPTAN